MAELGLGVWVKEVSDTTFGWVREHPVIRMIDFWEREHTQGRLSVDEARILMMAFDTDQMMVGGAKDVGISAAVYDNALQLSWQRNPLGYHSEGVYYSGDDRPVNFYVQLNSDSSMIVAPMIGQKAQGRLRDVVHVIPVVVGRGVAERRLRANELIVSENELGNRLKRNNSLGSVEGWVYTLQRVLNDQSVNISFEMWEALARLGFIGNDSINHAEISAFLDSIGTHQQRAEDLRKVAVRRSITESLGSKFVRASRLYDAVVDRLSVDIGYIPDLIPTKEEVVAEIYASGTDNSGVSCKRVKRSDQGVRLIARPNPHFYNNAYSNLPCSRCAFEGCCAINDGTSASDRALKKLEGYIKSLISEKYYTQDRETGDTISVSTVYMIN